MSSSDPEMSALVRAARSGDPDALEALVARYGSLVRACAMRVLHDPDDVADACQDTWLIMVQRIDSIRTAEALPGWLATTARREALRILRHRARSPRAPEHHLEQLEDPDDGPEERALRRDQAERVHRALGRLPSRHARLLIEVVARQRPYREVSRDLGCPIGSLGPLRARYLQQLSDELSAPDRALVATRS